MHAFTDQNGRPWALKIDVAAIKEIRDALQVDLLKALEGDLLQELAADPVKLVEVLWRLVREQAARDQLTEEQFGRALAGDSLEAATEAFLDELIAFFPQRQRNALATLRTKSRHYAQTATTAAMSRLEGPSFERAMEAILTKSLATLDQQLEILASPSPPSPASPSPATIGETSTNSPAPRE